MATLYGRQYSRAELLQRVGRIEQVAGVEAFELADGSQRGVRALRLRTGGGLECTVLADRGLDIAGASYRGAALAWQSAAGAPAPAFYEPQGVGWVRGFHGGLLALGGLSWFGAAGEDEGRPLGLHGRASYLPATNVGYGLEWEGDEAEMWLGGTLREAALFDAKLRLERRLSARLGENTLTLVDRITNDGWEPTPYMLLYHCNFGFPLLSPESELLLASEAQPRDADAAAGLGEWRRFEPPTPGSREQVFYHTPRADGDGMARVALVNRGYGGGAGAGLGVWLRWHTAELPCLVQWKMMGQGDYVCGLEPATNWVGGRAEERAAGRLRTLAPGESRTVTLEIGVLAGVEAIGEYEAGG